MIRRRFCTCGRVIWRGEIGRMCGAGVARYWVRTSSRIWRHIGDRTPACDPPGDWAEPEAGHLGANLQQVLLVIVLLLFAILLLRMLGVAI